MWNQYNVFVLFCSSLQPKKFHIWDGMSVIKNPFWNTNDSITNAEKLRQYKSKFSLVVWQILAFAWSPNIVREVKNLSSNFKQIAWQCSELLNALIRIVRSILSLNCKQFHQTFYSNILCIVDITCHFLTLWKKVSYMVKILAFCIIMTRIFTMS